MAKKTEYYGVEFKSSNDERKEKKVEEEEKKKYYNGFENMLKNFPNEYEYENVPPEKSLKEEINLLKQRIESIEGELDKLKKKSNKKTTRKVKNNKKKTGKNKTSKTSNSSSSSN